MVQLSLSLYAIVAASCGMCRSHSILQIKRHGSCMVGVSPMWLDKEVGVVVELVKGKLGEVTGVHDWKAIVGDIATDFWVCK